MLQTGANRGHDIHARSALDVMQVTPPAPPAHQRRRSAGYRWNAPAGRAAAGNASMNRNAPQPAATAPSADRYHRRGKRLRRHRAAHQFFVGNRCRLLGRRRYKGKNHQQHAATKNPCFGHGFFHCRASLHPLPAAVHRLGKQIA